MPRYCAQAQNLQILSYEPPPDFPRLAKSEAAISGGSAESSKLRIRYNWRGQQFDEDIYGMVEIFRAPLTTMFGAAEIIVWFVDALFSFRTADEELSLKLVHLTLLLSVKAH
nr:hypothetical protein [Chloroflexota bacterium]